MATRAALPWPHANRAVAVPRCVLAARFRGRPRHCLPWNPACQLDGVQASKGARRRRGCALALFNGSRAAKPGNREHPAGCLVQWRGSRFGCERSWVQCPRQPHVDARGAPYSACRCAICRQTGNARKKQSLRAGSDTVPRKTESPRKTRKTCISRESNPGRIHGSSAVYHYRALSAQPATASAEPGSEARCARARSIAAAARSSRSRADAATRAGAVLRSQMRRPAAQGGAVAAISWDSRIVSEAVQTTSAPGVKQ